MRDGHFENVTAPRSDLQPPTAARQTMNLHEYLFGERAILYAVLDGAAIPDLPAKLFAMRPPHTCLYRGDLDADLAEVAPYLVQLVHGAEFTNWLLANCWGKSWGIFAHSQFSLVEVRKHFRRFLTVHDDAGNPLLFRYYDPRVLNKYLPTCESPELETLFSKVTNYFVESNDHQNLLCFKFADALAEQSLPIKTA